MFFHFIFYLYNIHPTFLYFGVISQVDWILIGTKGE